jgi:Domain of unknown function (DUF4157)
MAADRLTAQKQKELGTLRDFVDCRRVRLYQDDSGLGGLVRRVVLGVSRKRAIALGNHVFLPDRCRDDVAVLAHELTHCGQYQRWGPLKYFSTGAVTQLRHFLHQTLRLGSSPYEYRHDPLKPFESYGMEQQGQIVEDAFRGLMVAKAISPYQPGRGSEDQAVPSA